MKNEDLKKIPGVGSIIEDPEIKLLLKSFSPEIVKSVIRSYLETVRQGAKKGRPAPSEEIITSNIKEKLNAAYSAGPKPVINSTGIILNTNLGRAPLGSYIASEIKNILKGYSNLEVDLKTGKRSKRMLHVSELIRLLTGAEDAVIVNNNAAAVFLIMKVFAESREVIVSRGELLEIGGSFRMPDIIRASGAVMREVGTTNRTNLSDYERAVNQETSIILKVHKSNFTISGFTEETPIQPLSKLGREKNLIMVYDIGSGLLDREGLEILKDEPTVKDSITSGCDLVTFSADKLLGGPQAGIIAGRKALVEKLSKDPLMRTYRVDKIILAGLSAVLKCHLAIGERRLKIPVYSMLSRSTEEVKQMAQKLSCLLKDGGVDSEVTESTAYPGGGTLPGVGIKSYAVRLLSTGKRKDFAQKIYFKLLSAHRPVMGILKNGELYFDVLTLFEDEILPMAEEIKKAYEEYHNGNGRTY